MAPEGIFEKPESVQAEVHLNEMAMNRWIRTLTFLVLTAAMMPPDTVRADSIFKYTDDSGRTHYVDDLSKIPEKYRKEEARPHALPTIMRENGQAREAFVQATRSPDDAGQFAPLEEYSPQEEPDDSPGVFSAEEERMLRETGWDDEALSGVAFLRKSKPFLFAAILLVLVNLIAYGVVLSKGGLPGLAVIVPIYNFVLLSRLGGFSGWWILWCLLPGVGSIIWSATVHYGIATSFDKSTGFAIFTAIFPFIGIPILMFTADNLA